MQKRLIVYLLGLLLINTATAQTAEEKGLVIAKKIDSLDMGWGDSKATFKMVLTNRRVVIIGGSSAGATMPTAINSAVEGLGRALAVELAPIRVNIISPGLVDTPVWDFMSDQKRNTMFEMAASMISIGRVGQPEDITTDTLPITQYSFPL